MQHKEGRHRWHHGVQPGLGSQMPSCESQLCCLRAQCLGELVNHRSDIFLFCAIGIIPWRIVLKSQWNNDCKSAIKHIFFKNIYSSGCVRSLLYHVGSLLHSDSSRGTCAQHHSSGAELFCSMWNLSSLTWDWTHVSCNARCILNHWTTREVPRASY